MADYVTVRGPVATATGSPAVGVVAFAAAETERLAGSHTLVTEQPVEIKLVDGELPPTQLLISQQPDLDNPLLVEMRLYLQRVEPAVKLLLVPGAPGDELWLSDLVEVPLEDYAPGQVAVVPWSMVGVANGIAPLDAHAKVPLRYLPESTGGDRLWTKVVHDVPEASFVVEHDFDREPAAISLYSLDLSERYEGYQIAHLDTNRFRVSMEVPTACVVLIS